MSMFLSIFVPLSLMASLPQAKKYSTVNINTFDQVNMVKFMEDDYSEAPMKASYHKFMTNTPTASSTLCPCLQHE